MKKKKSKSPNFNIANVKPVSDIGEDNLKLYLCQSYKHDWHVRKMALENLKIIDDIRARNRIRDLSFDEATQIRMSATNYACILGITTPNGNPIRLQKMRPLFLLKQMKSFKGSLLEINDFYIKQGIVPTYKEFINKYKKQNPALYDLVDGRCTTADKTNIIFKDQCRLAKIEFAEGNGEASR